MIYNLEFEKSRELKVEIELPTSKSIANRLLIISLLCDDNFEIENISESDDTKILEKVLKQDNVIIDIELAGTAMRFLTAYFACCEDKNVILTGNDRMQERPISILVEALKKLGADIKYCDKNGFPPLEIRGKKLIGNKIKIDGSVSSQYITALLLIAPILKNGLKIEIENKISSLPYILQTLKLMGIFGAKYIFQNNIIEVKKSPYKYKKKNFSVEADWSAVSYWYSVIACSENGNIYLKNLQKTGLQGDEILESWFDKLGVETVWKEKGAYLRKKKNINFTTFLELDFSANPDLAQTMVVVACILKIPFRFTGLHSLRIKETDRIQALVNEMKKCNIQLISPKEGVLIYDGKEEFLNPKEEIKTYNDHRMAMAFAPIVFHSEKISIKNPQVVSKSYPNFWKDMKKVGVRF